MYDIYEGDDTYWMSMELIEGGELFEHLIEEGAYSEAQAAIFLRQFAEALAFMHKAGGELIIYTQRLTTIYLFVSYNIFAACLQLCTEI